MKNHKCYGCCTVDVGPSAAIIGKKRPMEGKIHYTLKATPVFQCMHTLIMSLCFRQERWVWPKALERRVWGLKFGWDRHLAPNTVSLSRHHLQRTEKPGRMTLPSSCGLMPSITQVSTLLFNLGHSFQENVWIC